MRLSLLTTEPAGLKSCPYSSKRTLDVRGILLLPLAGAEIYAKTPPDKRAEAAIGCIRQMNQDLHDATDGRHARFFQEIKNREGAPMVPRHKLPDIARTALGDGSIFYNPEELDYEDLMMVIEAAWEGVPLDRSKIKKG